MELKRFMIQFRHGGSEWGTQIWAKDIEEARRKFASLKANGEIYGPVYQAKVPGFIPIPVVAFFLTVTCAVMNAIGAVKKAITGK